ncbi:MAG: hypothetical protein M1820_003074 [Bogoriella megaspora]|nr:MAG: hypothetical protein M1820_003074 [Bogoriella megaspora]
MLVKRLLQIRAFSTSHRRLTSLSTPLPPTASSEPQFAGFMKRASVVGIVAVVLGAGAMNFSSTSQNWANERRKMQEAERKRQQENSKLVEAYGDGGSLEDIERAVQEYGRR